MNTTNTAAAADETTSTSRGDIADKVIRNYALGSIVPSLIPVPMVDLVGVTGIQLKMLHSLARTYDVPFKEEVGRSVITALIGGTGSLGAARIVSSAVKAIPFVGQITAAVTMPVINGGTTYAIGKVFKQHFESGGTFLTFDATKVRAYFEEQLKAGKAMVAGAMASGEAGAGSKAKS